MELEISLLYASSCEHTTNSLVVCMLQPKTVQNTFSLSLCVSYEANKWAHVDKVIAVEFFSLKQIFGVIINYMKQ